MTSTSDKPFHTYENVGYDDQTNNINSTRHYATPPSLATTNSVATALATTTNNGCSISSGLAINKAAMDLPFPDPLHGKLCNMMPKYDELAPIIS